MTELRTINSSTYTPKKQFKSRNTYKFKLTYKYCFTSQFLFYLNYATPDLLVASCNDRSDDLNKKKRIIGIYSDN